MHRSKARRSQAIKGTPGRVADLKDAANFQKLSSKYSDRLTVLLTYTARLHWLKMKLRLIVFIYMPCAGSCLLPH